MDINITPPEMLTIVDIQFKTGGKSYSFDPGELELSAGQEVIIDTQRGQEYGICQRGNHNVLAEQVVQPLRPVVRLATEADRQRLAENALRESQAFELCQRYIEELSLDMKLIRVECAFDNSKLLFFFTSDGRVDFRELVKELASVYRTRIEMRQIGVRDEARLLGGLGICGRPFCCAEFLDDFQPVSIKMAKTQSLSLNPTKISGTCGRLMCCLKYEQDAYEDLIHTSPKPGSLVDTVDGRGTVQEVSLLRQQVKVRLDNAPDTVKYYPNEEIAVLRDGKGKKTDPPIPDDLAPISGNPAVKRRLQRSAPEAEEALPEIQFHSDLVDPADPAQESRKGPTAEQTAQPRSRNSRRRRGGRPASNGEPSQKAEGVQKPAANRSRKPKADQPVPREHSEHAESVEHSEKPDAVKAEAQAGGSRNSRPRRRRPHNRGGAKPQAPTGGEG